MLPARRTAIRLVTAAAILFGLSALSSAQAPTPPQKSVKGEVLGAEDVPLARAVVQLKDTKTLQIRSFVSQDDGSYRFSGLRRDTDYELKATYQGKSSDTKRLSTFDTRDEAVVVLRIPQ
jgi:hypothetical protein